MAEIEDLDKYLADCTNIYPETLEEEFVRLSADLAYWSGQAEKALRAHLRQKLEVERARARAALSLRLMAEKTGAKLTESKVEDAVALDPEYMAAQNALVETECAKVKHQNILHAIGAKKEMMVSLGANIRQEKEHDPVIRERAATRRALREQR